MIGVLREMDKADLVLKQPEIFLSAYLCSPNIGFDDVDIHLIVFRDNQWPIHSRFIHDDVTSASSSNAESGPFENFCQGSIMLRG